MDSVQIMRTLERNFLSLKDNRTVILRRQDFLPDRIADGDLLFTLLNDPLAFRRSLSSNLKNWLTPRRRLAIHCLLGCLVTYKARSAGFTAFLL